jgi:hypothetical protein
MKPRCDDRRPWSPLASRGLIALPASRVRFHHLAAALFAGPPATPIPAALMSIKTLHITNFYHPASGGIRTFYNAVLDAANHHRRFPCGLRSPSKKSVTSGVSTLSPRPASRSSTPAIAGCCHTLVALRQPTAPHSRRRAPRSGGSLRQILAPLFVRRFATSLDSRRSRSRYCRPQLRASRRQHAHLH